MYDCWVCVFVTQVRLEWPTDLAINPLDNSLYILDNNIVLQVKKKEKKKPPEKLTMTGSFKFKHWGVYKWKGGIS